MHRAPPKPKLSAKYRALKIVTTWLTFCFVSAVCILLFGFRCNGWTPALRSSSVGSNLNATSSLPPRSELLLLRVQLPRYHSPNPSISPPVICRLSPPFHPHPYHSPSPSLPVSSLYNCSWAPLHALPSPADHQQRVPPPMLKFVQICAGIPVSCNYRLSSWWSALSRPRLKAWRSNRKAAMPAFIASPPPSLPSPSLPSPTALTHASIVHTQPLQAEPRASAEPHPNLNPDLEPPPPCPEPPSDRRTWPQPLARRGLFPYPGTEPTVYPNLWVVEALSIQLYGLDEANLAPKLDATFAGWSSLRLLKAVRSGTIPGLGKRIPRLCVCSFE